METNTNIYSNDDLTVTFEPCLCIHAEKCAQELSEVFRLSIIPWIDLEATETKKIINQIKRCPSGALKYRLNTKKEAC
tara:strand:+ start:968 stop:1201 length:234 start_codon:yes stop_codon:yes gene_type:complete